MGIKNIDTNACTRVLVTLRGPLIQTLELLNESICMMLIASLFLFYFTFPPSAMPCDVTPRAESASDTSRYFLS